MRYPLTLIILSVIAWKSWSQLSVQDLAQLRETLLFEVSGEVFIPGESVQVAFNLKRTEKEKSTFLSKVAYLELIDDRSQSILQEKVFLNKGIGNAELYLPSFLKTGSYTLIAYTRWMKNYDINYVMQRQISVINPFENIPESFFYENNTVKKVVVDLKPISGVFARGSQKVIFSVTNEDSGEGIPCEGRITDAQGNSIGSFQTATGHGSLDLVINEVGTYNVVIVDKSSKIFFEKLKVDFVSNRKFQITDDTNKLVIDQEGIETQALEITFQGNPILKVPFVQGKAIVSKVDLPKGISWVLAKDSDRVLLQYPVVNQPNLRDLSINLEKSVYSSREKVLLTLSSKEEIPADMNLSISVRQILTRKNGFNLPSAVFANGHAMSPDDPSLLNKVILYGSPRQATEPVLKHLPDLRGNLISGKLVNDQLQAITDNEIAIALPDSAYRFHATRTNDNGNFFLYTEASGWRENTILYTEAKENVNLTIDDPTLADYTFVENSKLKINEEDKQQILARSIAVQIENAYFDTKPNNTLMELFRNDFFREIDLKVYNLDDFTRFPSVEDAIREFVSEAWLRKDDGGAAFSTPYIPNKSGNLDSALVLMNGIPVDPDWILQQNPLDMKAIEVYQNQVKFGPWEFQGIINFQLYKFDKDEVKLPGNYKELNYDLPLPSDVNRHFDPSGYEETKWPDFRSQLFWEPHFSFQENDSLEFYTSDHQGTFEIVISGVDEDSYVLARKTFQVRN